MEKKFKIMKKNPSDYSHEMRREVKFTFYKTVIDLITQIEVPENYSETKKTVFEVTKSVLIKKIRKKLVQLF